MKKIKYIFIFVFVLFSLFSYGKLLAESGSVTVNVPTTFTGGSVTVTVNGTNANGVSISQNVTFNLSSSCTLVSGSCGSANGSGFYSTPTTNLCNSGTASAVSGTGPWSWSCVGSCGGSTASCSALLSQTGSCGPAATTYPSTASTYAGSYCSVGTQTSSPAFPTAGSSSSWYCSGVNGGSQSALCTAVHSASTIVNGSCGTSSGQSFYSAPTGGLCSSGTASSVTGTGPWSWSCLGSGGGTNASCYANLKQDGSCGPAATTYPSTASSYAGSYCSVGTQTSSPAFPPAGSSSSWYCSGVNGGSQSALCTAVHSLGTVPSNVDVKATVWSDGTRTTAFAGELNSNGPVWVYSQAPYKISWGAVTDATSCTLNGVSVSTSGGSVDTYTYPLNQSSLTYTLSCTGSGGTTNDTVTLNLPPKPTNLNISCPVPGTTVNSTWTAPGGYTTFYTRAYDRTSSSYSDWNDSFVGTTRSFSSTAGHTYYSWIHSKESTTGAWSDAVTSPDVTCQAASSCIGAGSGTGILGKYYDGMTLGTLVTTRIDTNVNFNPADSLGVNYANSPDGNTFSVHWEGQVEPRCTENYTFYTTSDDGVRLWVNGTQLVNNWTDHGTTENSGTISLTAGQKYPIVMEFYENGGGAVSQLSWSSPSTAKAIIPQTQLYPACTTLTFVPATSGFSSGTTGSSGNSITVFAGSTFYSYVDYGQLTDSILGPNVSGSYGCPFDNANIGTAIRFVCTAPSTPGTYTYTSGTFNVPPPGSNVCASSATVGTVTVLPLNGNAQGYKVKMPGNSTSDSTISGQTVTIDGGSPISANPYIYTIPSGGHTVAVTVPAGYTAGYTLCYNSTSCHSNTPTSGSSVVVNVPAGGFADLWWHFTPNLPSYNLTVTKTTGGSVKSDDGFISCGTTCAKSYTQGTSVTLTAVPDSTNWKFVGWSGACTGSATSCTLTIDSAKSVTAIFAPRSFIYQEF